MTRRHVDELLAEAVGLDLSVHKHVTEFTLHVQAGKEPALFVTHFITADMVPATATARFRLVPIDDAPAPATVEEAPPLDFDVMASMAWMRLAQQLDLSADSAKQEVSRGITEAARRLGCLKDLAKARFFEQRKTRRDHLRAASSAPHAQGGYITNLTLNFRTDPEERGDLRGFKGWDHIDPRKEVTQ